MVRTGKLQDGRRFDPSRVAVSTERTALPADPTMSGEGGMAKIERWDSGDIEVATESPHPAMLVLSQRDYPGWKAEVDGRPAKILPVDGVIQGVELPAGSHRVTLSFAPAHLLWLSLVAVLALLGSFALVVFGKPTYSRPMTHAT